MAASDERVTPREVSISASIQINSIEAERHILHLPSSVTANTDEANAGELSPINAYPEPLCPNISISDNDCDNSDNSDNSPYPQTPSKSKSKSKSKSHSLSFSYEESQIGQFYKKQQAAKKTQKYQSYPKTSIDEHEDKDDWDEDDDEKDDQIMDKILIHHQRQESAPKDIRRYLASRNLFASLKQKSPKTPGLTHKLFKIKSEKSIINTRQRAETDPPPPPIPKSPSLSDDPFIKQHVQSSQSNIINPPPLPLRIEQWRSMTEIDEPTPMAPLSLFNSNPISEQLNDTDSPWNHSVVRSISIQSPIGRRPTITPKQSTSTISRVFFEPQSSLEVYGADVDSASDDDEDEDEKEQEDSPKPEKIKMGQKQAELAIQRTTQLLMVSSGNSKEVFQSLWKICIALKKDPTYHVSFSDKLLKHNHVEEFLRLLGFVKDKSSSRWSCFAHTRVQASLIDTAILECHKCRQSIQQRGTTIDLVNQHKKSRKDSDTLQPKLSLPLVQQSQSVGSQSEVFSISENEKNDSNSVQLYELIWGITHNNNDDPCAKDVLLLCYPVVTNAKYILYCLQCRFFKDDHDGRKTLDYIRNPCICSADTLSNNLASPNVPHISQNSSFEYGTKKMKYDKILSSFSVQAKVIEFIRHWMVRFWDKDWDSDRKLVSYCKIFMRRIRKAYESEENQDYYEPLEIQRGLRLVEMLEKTMQTQKSRKRMGINKMLTDQCGNKGLLSPDSGGNGGKTRHKKRSSIFALGFSPKKVSKGPKNLMDVNYVIIAEQITVLQFNLFKKIHPRECLKQAWKSKERKHRDAPNITEYIDAFNTLTKWLQSSILAIHGVKLRGRTIKKWVKVEEELLKLRNFQALCAVYSGLASSPIYRLKDAWSYVPKKHITQHEKIRVIMKSNRNWKNLRSLQLQTHPPMLPYFGMFAQDMIAIEETSSNRNNDGSINWDALCRGQAAIDKHLNYQNSPYSNLNTDSSIQRWMDQELTMSGKLDNEWVYQVSETVVLKDKRELGKDITPKKKGISLWKSK